MKFLVVGLGSMGKRRVRNLLANDISPDDIFGLDIRQERCDEASDRYRILAHTSMMNVDLKDISVMVVSTPPDHHLSYARMAIDNDKHVFIEASVLAHGLAELADLADLKDLIVFPSCTMRYFTGPLKLEELIKSRAIGQIFAWQYQSGQYLPDWHPWEAISDFYVSKKDTGGCREIVPFEMVWLTKVFGPVRDLDARYAKLSILPVEIDDIYLVQTRHQDDIYGQMIVDVLSRTPIRHLRVTGSGGTIEWDDTNKVIRLFSAETRTWTDHFLNKGTLESNYINPEEPYIEEIRIFLECVRSGQQPTYTLRDDIEVLNLLNLAEESAKLGKRQHIMPI